MVGGCKGSDDSVLDPRLECGEEGVGVELDVVEEE
jgi:hypothetical protein